MYKGSVHQPHILTLALVLLVVRLTLISRKLFKTDFTLIKYILLQWFALSLFKYFFIINQCF